MEEVEYLLEQVLYYARSETVERDYFFGGFKLSDVIHAALLQYRMPLLRWGLMIDITDLDDLVHSDEKWVAFMIGQKFKKQVKLPLIEENGFILFYTNGCPYTAKYVPIVENAARSQGIPFRRVKIDSLEKAKNACNP
jgi:hypothetical protein